MNDPVPAQQTIREAVQEAARRLESAGIESPRLDAEVLMRQVLGLDRTRYFLKRTDPIAAHDRAEFEALLQRRLTWESVAYIIGSREFMGRSFAVGPGVLVPRPETEILVEWALDWLTSHPGDKRILDVGTGSGAIALSIASADPAGAGHRVVGSDVSRAALQIAARNREVFDLQGVVSLVLGNLADWHGGPIDLLLANLPYLRPDQVSGNLDLAAEPELALVGGPNGLNLVRQLLEDAPRVLSPSGSIGLEIDPSQAETTVALGQRHLPALDWQVIPDLAGHPRHVVGMAR